MTLESGYRLMCIATKSLMYLLLHVLVLSMLHFAVSCIQQVTAMGVRKGEQGDAPTLEFANYGVICSVAAAVSLVYMSVILACFTGRFTTRRR